MRVLVCGDRRQTSPYPVFAALDVVHTGQHGPVSLLVEGASDEAEDGTSRKRGWDYWAHIWALSQRGVIPVRMPAAWRRLKKRAGPIRNAWMVETIRPELVVAGPGGVGTANMVKQARAAGIEVLEVE